MPIPFLAEAAIAGVSAGLNIFGGASQDAAQNRATRIAYDTAMDNWKYTNKEGERDYRYQKKGVEIARQNEVAERSWRDTTAISDYNHGMAIRDYEYKNQMRAYNKSEQTYRQQLNFNNMAAQVAMESEDRWLDERFKETAFQNQDLFVQMLQEEGRAAAMGQAGRSAGKTMQAVLAQAGRNQAILAESLYSAEKQHKVNIKKIGADKYGADLQAEASRMLKPEISPALPKPLPLPKAIFQDPKKWKKTPKPRMGATTSANTVGAITSSIGNIIGGIKW
jgi:hypothetical protein